MDFVHRFDLKTPAPVSAVSFGTDDTLAVGSGEHFPPSIQFVAHTLRV